MHGFDLVGGEFGAQRGDVGVDRARRRERGVAPHDAEELVARHRLAFAQGEQFQHGELFCGQC